VNTEADSRVEMYSQMSNHLSKFYLDMEDNKWLNNSLERTKDLQLPSVALDFQLKLIK
ncbi:hypothetical protein BgiMline_021535, partial [Biomphalaria glabrata]